MIIHTRQIPEEGLLLEGEEPQDIFQLAEEGFRSLSPLRYRLTATLQDQELFLEGWTEARFELRCVRCLEPFIKTVRIDPYHLLEPLEKLESMDLTERLREDTLLDLPGYPKCEQADSPRECPALKLISPESDFQTTETSETEKDVWGALDKIQPKSDAEPEA